MVSEDLVPFFAEFGQACAIAGGSVTGIFDAQPQQAFGLVDASGPALTIRSSDWASVTRGESVTVAAVAYTVIGIEPDGTGITILRLQRT